MIDAHEGQRYRMLFVVGCPRSGTTWIQLILSQFDAIATAPETQIFAYYLVQFERQWEEERRGENTPLGRAGLSRVLDEAEFLELCGRSARMVLDKILSRKPGAQVVVEKSPKHALHASFIRRVFPDAYFLHVIRDPRDTAASLMAAGRTWGDSWAPRGPVQAARMWVEHIRRARQVATGDGRYREIRYERVKEDPETELAGVLEWLGVSTTAAERTRAIEACDFERLKAQPSTPDLPLPSVRAPDGFFRRGESGSWRTDLSRSELRVIEHICGPLMTELGYERVTSGARAPARVLMHDAVHRVRESIDWQLARALSHL